MRPAAAPDADTMNAEQLLAAFRGRPGHRILH